MIEARYLSVTLGRSEVVQHISISMGPGEFVGLVGPNGAGKSTLLRALSGAPLPMSGDVLADGKAIRAMTHDLRARSIAWLSQSRPVAWNMLSEDVVALGRFVLDGAPYERLGEADRAAIDLAMEQVGARAFVGRRVLDLSGGEQARLHLARVLASPARVLLLDEPCAALDIAHQFDVMSLLTNEARDGRLVVAALHDLALAERYCTRILVMQRGQIVADGTPDTAFRPDVLQDVFGVRRTGNGALERIL